jgi:hypothetical protein
MTKEVGSCFVFFCAVAPGVERAVAAKNLYLQKKNRDLAAAAHEIVGAGSSGRYGN